MKISISVIFLSLIFSLVQAQFQPAQVKKSTQIIRHQGVNYYIHTIRQGQTLYRICHTYEVTEEELKNANPGVPLSPLSIGQVLRIPVIKNVKADNSRHSDDTKIILHTVRAKETPYFLHKKYNVPLEVIYSYNPGSESGIQVGQVIRIPGKTGEPYNLYRPQEKPDLQEVQIQQETFTSYRVKKGDTLYQISREFAVNLSDLIFVNPELRWGLKTGQLLKIPGESFVQQNYALLFPDSIISILSFEKFTRYQCDSIRSLKRFPPPVKAVLMLPFFASETTESEFSPSDSLAEMASSKRKRLRGRVAAEFYEGFLLSLDTLRKRGLNMSLFVYDTEGDTNRVKQILNDLEIVEPDIIIGPLSPANIQLVSQFSFERKIPLVPPLATKDYLFKNNPYLFRTIPSEKIERKAYTDYLTKESLNKNIILVHKKSMKFEADIDSFKTAFMAGLAGNPFADTILLTEVLINDSLAMNLDSALHETKVNLVFIFSSYEPEVITTLARLHFLKREHEIIVYGMPAWQKFDNIRIDVVHELQVTVHTPFYIDYKNKDVQDFVLKCRNKLKYEPYLTTRKGTGINYTYLGYDMGMYFIQNLRQYEENICACIEYTETEHLLSRYKYRRNPLTGSLENSSLSYIQYDTDYIVKLLKTDQ